MFKKIKKIKNKGKDNTSNKIRKFNKLETIFL